MRVRLHRSMVLLVLALACVLGGCGSKSPNEALTFKEFQAIYEENRELLHAIAEHLFTLEYDSYHVDNRDGIRAASDGEPVEIDPEMLPLLEAYFQTVAGPYDSNINVRGHHVEQYRVVEFDFSYVGKLKCFKLGRNHAMYAQGISCSPEYSDGKELDQDWYIYASSYQ